MATGFSLEMIEQAWSKARIVEGFDADIFRKDACGAWIHKDMFSQQGSMYGWGVDLILPTSMGGTCVIENIRLGQGTVLPTHFTA